MTTTTEQKFYDFYVDQKVTTWYRTNFEIEASSEEEAKQKALEFIERGDESEIGWEHIDGCLELLSPRDNGGESTKEVYYSNDHGDALEIYSNKQ